MSSSYLMKTVIVLVGYIGAYLGGIFVRSAVTRDREIEFAVPGVIGLIVTAAVCWYTYSNGMYLLGTTVIAGFIIGFLS